MEKGSYLTSFLEISVDTDQDLSNLATLDEKPQGTYYHEYFHYMQDVTTASGLCKIWNGFDRLRQLISSIQPPEVTEVNAPLEGQVAEEQQAHLDFLEDLRGAGQLTGVNMNEADTYEIAEIVETENPRIQQYFPDSRAYSIQLHLQSKDKVDKLMTFGEYAISETMAYMIEKKFYPELNVLPRYPYKVAIDVVKFCYPELADKGEIVFALCDIALMYNMPGWAFVSILRQMKVQDYEPKSGEDVVIFGYGFYDQTQWDAIGYMNYADKAMQAISDTLYQGDYYAGTKQLLQANIERGRIQRSENPYFMVQIYRQEKPLSLDFYKVYNFLGGPLSVNSSGGRWARVPLGLDWLEPISDPSHFRVAWQLNKFFTNGERKCSLIKTCRAAQNPVGVDDRCDHRPWQRAFDEQLCPFAAAWHLYGFKTKDFYLEGRMIQQGSD